MSKREWILAALLAVAAAMFVVGVALVDTRAAWLAAAILLAVWSWLVFAEGGG